MKIAHIQLLPILSGVQRVTFEEFSRIERSKFSPTLICKEEGPLTYQMDEIDINTIYCESLVREISPISDLKALISLYRIFREHKFDIVHTHSSKTGVLGRIAARLAGVPVVVHTVHGYAFPSAKSQIQRYIYFAMEWLGMKCSDLVICLHQDDENLALARLGAKPVQLAVLANGVDVEKFSPLSRTEKLLIKKKLGLLDNTPVVGMVGRLWEQKNPLMFANAAISLLNKGVQAQFIFVGDGELRDELKSLINSHGWEEHIVLLGWRDDVESILKALDVFVLPSLWEGMPLAILEAQSSGIPCVVSDIQGNRHLVSNDVDGFIFSLDEPEALESHLVRLISDSELRERQGSQARQKVIEKFNINDRVVEASKLYETYLNSKLK